MPSLEQIQQALAASLTQSAPSAPSAPSAGQPGNSAAMLAGFDRQELVESRETLLRKRISQIASMLPDTKVALGSSFEPEVREFVTRHHFQGIEAIRMDAIEFARSLKHRAHVADCVKELAAWEALRIEWVTYRYLLRFKRFKYQEYVLPEGIRPPLSGSLWVAWRWGRWGEIVRLK